MTFHLVTASPQSGRGSLGDHHVGLRPPRDDDMKDNGLVMTLRLVTASPQSGRGSLGDRYQFLDRHELPQATLARNGMDGGLTRGDRLEVTAWTIT